jgi:Fic family protein
MGRILLSRIEKALNKHELDELIDILNAEGFSQLEIYGAYHRLYEKYQKQNNDKDIEYITDVMDTIVHWGNRDHWHHFSKPMTREEYFKKYDKFVYNYYKKNNKDLSGLV